jgi:radical SAM superfamily enzyme YgiQ (UPF0313 family)
LSRRLSRFPWIDIICRGEGELTGTDLVRALKAGAAGGMSATHGQDACATDLSAVAGISYRNSRGVFHNPDRPRIADLDSIGFPAWEKVDLKQYAGYGMMTSRGCPYKCTFCSVAPVWNHESYSRSPANIVAEMRYLHEHAGVSLFLFQDEFFVSGKAHVMEFCRELAGTGLPLKWKAFGRVNLMDEEMMHAMADCGCLEMRFGIESGSDKVLKLIKKGFTAAQSLEIVPKAIPIFPRVDTFFVWGYPFETMEDFNQSLFQMVSFRMMGARILPSLLSLLPQTEIYRDYVARGVSGSARPIEDVGRALPDIGTPTEPACKGERRLEFCRYLLPEFVFTGHEITRGGEVEVPPRYKEYFDLIVHNPDIFPGFFHIDLKNNVLPKLALLRQFGFYPAAEES